MKKKNVMPFIATTVLIIAGLVSCASTGQYLPMAKGETPVGTVYTVFEAKDTWFTQKAINTLAQIKLMEAATPGHSGNIEIRDIIWVAGRETGRGTSEISASGKVVKKE